MGFLIRSRETRTNTALGVDVGSGVVKLALAEQAGTRVDLLGAGGCTIEDGAIDGGIVLDPRRLGKRIASYLNSWQVGPTSAVISVPSHLATLRWVNLPPLAGEELRDAARFKVKRHLPFPVGSAYVEATPPVAEGEDAGQSLVIAVPRNVIDSRAEALEHAGMIPVGAELEAQAILRVVERRLNQLSALWRDASLTIIDVGSTNTHMYVVQNQRLQFIRGVKFGGRKIAEALAQELSVSLGEAEMMLAQPDTELFEEGILKVRVGDVYHLIYVNQEVEKLTREFLRLLRYFRSLHPERSYAGILDHVMLCGGLAGLNGFAEYLEVALGLRVERAKPLSGMVTQIRSESFGQIASRQEAYTVVVGLALSGLKAQNHLQEDENARHEYRWSRAS